MVDNKTLAALKSLLNNGGGGGGGGVQSDWNQMDDTAADFIKNKPFGETPTVLYEGTDLAPIESDGAYILSMPNLGFIEGQAYSVVIDGVEYDTKGQVLYNTIPFIGNPGIAGAGEDDGSPYMCMVNVETMEYMLVMFVPFTSIRITTNTIQKIEQKFLPFNEIILDFGYYKGGSVKYLYNGTSDDPSNVVTFSDLKRFYRLGYPVYVRNGFNRHLSISANAEGFDNYGYLVIIKEDGTLERFYTAEYTPTT
jgi:hypothetical protein